MMVSWYSKTLFEAFWKTSTNRSTNMLTLMLQGSCFTFQLPLFISYSDTVVNVLLEPSQNSHGNSQRFPTSAMIWSQQQMSSAMLRDMKKWWQWWPGSFKVTTWMLRLFFFTDSQHPTKQANCLSLDQSCWRQMIITTRIHKNPNDDHPLSIDFWTI